MVFLLLMRSVYVQRKPVEFWWDRKLILRILRIPSAVIGLRLYVISI